MLYGGASTVEETLEVEGCSDQLFSAMMMRREDDVGTEVESPK
jgi:hypothetical protein